MNDIRTEDEELALALRALGHPVRLNILRILAERQAQGCCCTDVTSCLSLAQSTVSQHIKVLLDAGLIERVPRGTRNCYTIRPDRFDAMGRAFGGFLDGVSPALSSPTAISAQGN